LQGNVFAGLRCSDIRAAGCAGQNGFALNIFMAEKTSTGKNLDFSTFTPKIFGPTNFQTEKNSAKKISREKKDVR
jgi:hypothetical protein